MGMQLGGDRKGIMAEMNVVPLIDVLLVLLIIFMVITPLTPQGLEALIPQPADGETPPVTHKPDATVVVQVAADGQVRINQQESSWETLGPRLEEIFKRRWQRIAFVQGEDDVEFREVARVIGIMRGAGIESVGLLTADVLPPSAH